LFCELGHFRYKWHGPINIVDEFAVPRAGRESWAKFESMSAKRETHHHMTIQGVSVTKYLFDPSPLDGVKELLVERPCTFEVSEDQLIRTTIHDQASLTIYLDWPLGQKINK
jgi:hypothetical protein